MEKSFDNSRIQELKKQQEKYEILVDHYSKVISKYIKDITLFGDYFNLEALEEKIMILHKRKSKYEVKLLRKKIELQTAKAASQKSKVFSEEELHNLFIKNNDSFENMYVEKELIFQYKYNSEDNKISLDQLTRKEIVEVFYGEENWGITIFDK